MRPDNVKLDIVTYNILFSGSCKWGRNVESLQFFEDMMDLKIHLTKEVYWFVISHMSNRQVLLDYLSGSL
jgi:pentatricopeptide repeat protein